MFFEMFTIIFSLFTLIPFSFTKNGFMAPYQEIAAETIFFLTSYSWTQASSHHEHQIFFFFHISGDFVS